jgi:hypothetical protein
MVEPMGNMRAAEVYQSSARAAPTKIGRQFDPLAAILFILDGSERFGHYRHLGRNCDRGRLTPWGRVHAARSGFPSLPVA